MKSSNPILGQMSARAGQPTYTVAGDHPYDPYAYSYQQPVQTGRADVMTIDDVVVKTVSLLGTAVLFAVITAFVVPLTSIGPVWIGAMLIGLVLGLIISFAQVTNPVILFSYAIVEGVFLGAVSKAFEARYNGIVLQAVIGTLGVFLVMATLYKTKIIRATPKFMKIVIGITAGLAAVMLVNLLISLFTGSAGPLRDGGPLAIVFSLVCITVAALMFVVCFQQVEDGVAAGLPRKYGWLGAFAILVELVWLYLEILRLLSYFSED